LTPLAVAGAVLLGVTVYDVATHPHDIWTVITFGAGTLAGVTLDRWQRSTRR
jgi:hypothetical protein